MLITQTAVNAHLRLHASFTALNMIMVPNNVMTYFQALDHDPLIESLLSLIHTSGGKVITGKIDMQCSDDTMGYTICFHPHITSSDCDLENILTILL